MKIIAAQRLSNIVKPFDSHFQGVTLPETNKAHENLIFPGQSHQNAAFSMALLVYRSVWPFFGGL